MIRGTETYISYPTFSIFEAPVILRYVINAVPYNKY